MDNGELNIQRGSREELLARHIKVIQVLLLTVEKNKAKLLPPVQKIKDYKDDF